MNERTIFIKPIILGLISDVGGSFVFGLIIAFILGATAGTDSVFNIADPATWSFGEKLVIGLMATAFSVLGGYVAGHIAKTRKVTHAIITGCISAAFGILPLITALKPDGHVVNAVLAGFDIIVVVVAAYIGGWWAQQLSGTESTSSVLESLAQRVKLAPQSFVYVVLGLIVVYSMLHVQFEVIDAKCNVETIYVQGTLYTTSPGTSSSDTQALETYSAGTAQMIDKINKRPGIKAIFVDIDSAGGSPVAGEELANALKRSSKPTVALIRSIGASSAYWVATGAKTIFASSNSDVGSIGVQVNYLDSYQHNLQEGLSPNIITSAKYKTLGDPNLPLTAEEREIIQRDVDEVHKNFVAAVAKNRNMSVEAVERLADGATELGSRALENGLIDKLGDYNDVKEFLKTIIGEEPKICASYYPAPTN